MAAANARPKYRFCWWCSRQLRGRSHQTMCATAGTSKVAPVIVHFECAEEMGGEGGWQGAMPEHSSTQPETATTATNH